LILALDFSLALEVAHFPNRFPQRPTGPPSMPKRMRTASKHFETIVFSQNRHHGHLSPMAMDVPWESIIRLGVEGLAGSGFDEPLPAGTMGEGKRPLAMLIGSWPSGRQQNFPRLALLDFLLVAGANINAEIKANQTALSLAVASGKIGAVDWLLRHGAHVSMEDRLLASQLMSG